MEARRKERATREMFQVQRDGEGNVIPVDKEIDWEDTTVIVGIRPMSYGDIEDWNKKSEKDEGIGAKEIARTLAKHVAEPDLSDLTEQALRDGYKAMAVSTLLMAVMQASGMKGKVTVDDNMTAKVEVEDDEGNS